MDSFSARIVVDERGAPLDDFTYSSVARTSSIRLLLDQAAIACETRSCHASGRHTILLCGPSASSFAHERSCLCLSLSHCVLVGLLALVELSRF